MSDLPPITIIMTTWAPNDDMGVSRRETAKFALETLSYLRYDGELRLHVADDGSTFPGHPQDLVDGLWTGPPPTYSRQERHGMGASMNAGFAAAFEISPLVLFMTDDCALVDYLDLTPWASILLEDESVGMVRVGMVSPNIKGHIDRFSHGWAWRLERYAFAYAERPALFHRRFVDAYGPFEEDVSGINCEKSMVEHFAHTPGPDVIYAVLDPWIHTGKVSTAHLP